MLDASQAQSSRDSLAAEIAGLLALNLGVPAEAIPVAAGTRLFGVMPELDSMTVVTFLIAAEEQWSIVVHDDEVDAAVFENLGSLTDFIRAKLG